MRFIFLGRDARQTAVKLPGAGIRPKPGAGNWRRKRETPQPVTSTSREKTFPFALGAAALTFLITHNLRSTISVVIVAGACGIAAGTPLAILGGIGRSAQLGSIIKGGLYLESLATIDTILLDKTGTLTYGTRPKWLMFVPPMVFRLFPCSKQL